MIWRHMMEQNLFSEWIPKCNDFLKKTGKVLQDLGYKDEHIPAISSDGKKPISLVFVGQFSAGKSTIIKALTGIQEIEIGEGIKTDHVESYDWNGINVVDTPGIDTMLRPEHDELTYKAIAEADLLVYVITHELFDDNIGKSFRRLLIDENKFPEMILVVNKMADVGNDAAIQKVKLDDLRKVTDPHTPEELRTVFIDAKSYLDSLTIDDEELSEILKGRSNYDQLVSVLNRFANEKGYSGQLTTALYKTIEILQTAISHLQALTGDQKIDEKEEYKLRERRILSQTAWRIETVVKGVYESAAAEIREKGRDVAANIYNCDDEESAELLLEKAYHEADSISERCRKDIISHVEQLVEDGTAQLDSLYDSDISLSIQLELKSKRSSGNPFVGKLLKSDMIAKGSAKIVETTKGTDSAATGLKAFSGSKAQELVKKVGHDYFGHKFKPWEAVKWAKKINYVGKALGVFGVVFSWGIQVKEDIDENHRNQEMRSNRERIRAGFNDAAEELGKHYKASLDSLLNDNYYSKIRDIDDQLSIIQEQRRLNSAAGNQLEATVNECRNLIAEIRSASTDREFV